MTLPDERTAVKAITKNSIRQQVFAKFDSKGLQLEGLTTRPSISRLPAVHEAANKLVELPEYQNATTVVTKTGNTLKDIRLRALKDQKKLLVPIPLRADTGMFYLVKPPENADEKLLEKYVTRMGLHEKSRIVIADSNNTADIIVVGSVAVDRQGRRIGSGKDFCDLELAVMAHKGMITKDTIIATIVHDIQVMESLPEELFGEHDVGVGLIITPTEIVRVCPPPAPPPRILWKLVTKSVLQLVPVLRELHEVESKADPRACELKEEPADREVRPRRRVFRRRKQRVEKGEDERDRPRPKTDAREEQPANGLEQVEGEADGESARQPRHNRPDRPRTRKNDRVQNGERRPRSKYERRRSYQIDFSLCVRNLASDVRVRDLKNALVECQVKPAEIMWRGQEGYAVLHFARERPETSDTPTSMDGTITSLRNLKVSAAQEDGLVVEPYNRVTRIEVTDQVTAV